MLAAYKGNNIQYETVSAVSDEATGKALIEKMRATFSKMRIPSTSFNAWNKVKGGDLALETWSDPEDIIVLISADVEAKLDVNVLAKAFNMDKTDFLGRVIVVDSFTDGDVNGSAIQAVICDRSWFKIKTQDFAMDEFYNANNRTWQYYLNDVRMVNFSLFANAVAFVTSAPTVPATDVKVSSASATVVEGDKVTVPFELVPANATSEVTVSSSAEGKARAQVKGRGIEITGVDAGSATITVTANSHSATISVTVTEPASE